MRRIAFIALALSGCGHVEPLPTDETTMNEAPAVERARAPLRGLASFYADNLAGHRTASGEPYTPGALTCAHRTLPFGTRLRVTAERTGRSVTVRVNDRGPFVRRRMLDLSAAAAAALGLPATGEIRVKAEVLGP